MEPSGPHWVNRFPGSASTDDLLPEFRVAVTAFLHALREAGATLRIASTYRPPERAWLMHWSWRIANGEDPAKIPQLKTIPIDWQHTQNGAPDFTAARAAAKAMVARYGIRFAPALASHHTRRRAIDMTIGWKTTLPIRDAAGRRHLVTTPPRTGLNHDLIEIAKSFGVKKLLKDPPHWSDDGH